MIWMWEFRPIEREKQARDRKEISSQQFYINNINRHTAIRVENRDVIHMRSSWQNYIQLAMGENKFRQVNANDFHGLTLRLVNGHSECQLQGELALCKVNGHFEQFIVVVMCDMLTIFPTCVPPMIYAIINLHAKRQMIRRVPLQSPETASRFLSKITWTPTLKARRCGGIPTIIMVLRNSVPITIT